MQLDDIKVGTDLERENEVKEEDHVDYAVDDRLGYRHDDEECNAHKDPVLAQEAPQVFTCHRNSVPNKLASEIAYICIKHTLLVH